MLIFSRKIQESIVVGKSDRFDSAFKVTVQGVNEGKVRLSFEVMSDLPADPVEEWRRHDALEASSYESTDEFVLPAKPRELSFDSDRAHLTTEEIND